MDPYSHTRLPPGVLSVFRPPSYIPPSVLSASCPISCWLQAAFWFPPGNKSFQPNHRERPCCSLLSLPLRPSHVSCDKVSYSARIPPRSCHSDTHRVHGTHSTPLRRALELQREGGPRGPPCCVWLECPWSLLPSCPGLSVPAPLDLAPAFNPTLRISAQPRLLACLMH